MSAQGERGRAVAVPRCCEQEQCGFAPTSAPRHLVKKSKKVYQVVYTAARLGKQCAQLFPG